MAALQMHTGWWCLREGKTYNMQKLIKRTKENMDLRSIVCIVVLSMIMCGIFKDAVNYIVTYKFLPMAQVVVSTECYTEMKPTTDNVATIWYNKMGLDTEKSKLLYDKENGGCYEATFSIVKSPTEYIYVAVNPDMKEVGYISEGGISDIHILEEKEKEAGYFKIYPFASSYLKLIWQVFIYVILIAVIFFLLLRIHLFILEEKFLPAVFWKREVVHPYRLFLIVWVILYIVALGQYIFHIGTPHYLPDNALGDQGGYWATYIFKDGFFDFDFLAKLATFRGYMNYLFMSIARFLGHHLQVDAVKIYLLFSSFTFSWLTTQILPQLYQLATKRKPRLCQVFMSTLLAAYFWNTFLIGALGDFYCVSMFFGFLLYVIKTIKEKKFRYAVLSGLIFGMMVNWRVAYWYECLIMLVMYGAISLYERRKEQKEREGVWLIAYLRALVNYTKKYALHLFIAIMCFLIIAIPQGITNFKAGHIGILPYDSPQAYGGHPVTWSAWNTFLSYGMVLWPQFVGDDQLMTMKSQLYADRWQILYPQQAMDVYANSPIEFAACMIKKTFTQFDLKSNINYVDDVQWRYMQGLAFSFLNYFILAVGFFTLLKFRKVEAVEKKISWLTFVCIVLPMLVGHCEYRNFLPAYIILYYMFSYHFFGEVVGEGGTYREFCDGKFFQFLVLVLLLAFSETLTLWA